MNFIPEQQNSADVPFFDDVVSRNGWQGHTTGKSIETLKSEIMLAMDRLGGIVANFQKGSFVIDDKERNGFRLYYTVNHPNGALSPGQLDIAALPVKRDYRLRKTLAKRQKQSLKMALYMLRQGLDGLWFLQQLSPGYAPLLPWMLEQKTGQTIGQLWSNQVFSHLLPPGNSEFVEGEFEDIK